jgi:hypothetical protein
MYTLRMSVSGRALAFGLAILWVMVPQIACFMPDPMTEAEQECCEQMAHNCGSSGMSHECCRRVVRTDPATLAAASRVMAHDFVLVEGSTEIDGSALLTASTFSYFFRNSSPPIDTGPSSVILRI